MRVGVRAIPLDVDGRRYGRTRFLAVDSDLCLFAALAPASKEMRGWLSFLMSAPRYGNRGDLRRRGD